MKNWERRLYVITRDPFYLSTIVGIILLLGVIGAVITSQYRPIDPPEPTTSTGIPHHVPQDSPFQFKLEWLAQAFADEELSFAEQLTYMRVAIASMPAEAYPQTSQIVAMFEFEASEQFFLDQLAQGILLNDRKPTDALRDVAQQDPLGRYAALTMGHIYWVDGLRQTAAEWFEIEGNQFEEATHARKLALQTYADAGLFGKVTTLLEDARYSDVVDRSFLLDFAGKRQDWSEVFSLLLSTQFEYTEYTYVVLAVISMLIWLAFCLQAGQIKTAATLPFWLCLLAIPAGVFSTILTLFASIYQREVWGLVEQADIFGGITYYVVGVGLREELTKLLMFLPFVPILLKRGNDLETLIVGACVGLGFAAEENILYFQGGGALSAPTRFMTANFLHLALTGLAGLAFCRIFRNPKTGIVDFIAMFTAVVLLHGLYNSFQAVPGLTDLAIFTWTTFVGIGYLFFHEMRKNRLATREVFSLRATFLFGLSALVSIALMMLAAQFGFFDAVKIVVPAILQMLLIVYMFIRELSDAT